MSIEIEKIRFDKTKWEKVRFGEIVEEVTERVNDPEQEGIEHVVGLEHIDSEDIHLRKSDSVEEGSSSFSRKFSVGDVLFGRRRAYLKKAAQAEFTGICSGDIIVMRAKEDLLPELLPFLVNNEKFFDYAVQHSAGGLSPRVKFKALANYEFLLPPKDQQAELAELLWAMDEVIESENQSILNSEKLLDSSINQFFRSHIIGVSKKKMLVKSLFQTRREERVIPSTWKPVKLRDLIIDAQNGFAQGKRDENGIPQLRMNNVTRDGRIDLSKIARIPDSGKEEKYKIEKEDVLFCNTNSDDLVGKSIIADSTIDGFTFSNHFTRLRSNEKVLTQKFLYLWLKFYFNIGLFQRICTKWIGQAAVQTDSLLNLEILLPPLSEQKKATIHCNIIEDRIAKIESKNKYSNQLLKSLINQIL